MNYFNPEQTSPDASTHNYTATVADRLTAWGGLLENTFSVTRFDAQFGGKGLRTSPLLLAATVGIILPSRTDTRRALV